MADLSQVMDKMNRYSTAASRELHAKGKRITIFAAFLRASWAFFYNYFGRMAFLDGSYGLINAVSDATNKFFKYAKYLPELNYWQGCQGQQH